MNAHIRLVKMMVTDTENKVKVDDTLTNQFRVAKGVRQGYF